MDTSQIMDRAGTAPRGLPVSLCMIVRDEEANLHACLNSVADLVAEIVIVDTGSVDRTKVVALSYGARVYDFPWGEDFSAARNESLRHARQPWVFWMDADERLDADNHGTAGALFASLDDQSIAYVMHCRCPTSAHGGSTTVLSQVRLFRNDPQIRWRYRVHEQILPAIERLGGGVRWTSVVIDHVGYEEPGMSQRKAERNLELLRRENAEHPDDPFIWFYLGWTYQELGRMSQALPFLLRSLERSHPSASFVRKLYALLTRGYVYLNQRDDALTICRIGRIRYPDDVELLFLEATLLREQGNLVDAEASYLQLLVRDPKTYFSSVDAGFQGYRTRYALARLYQQQGLAAEAELQFRAALRERADFEPARLGLAQVCLAEGRLDDLDLDETLLPLNGHLQCSVEVALLRARGFIAQGQYTSARALLEQLIALAPQSLELHVTFANLLLQEGADTNAAIQALRDVLALDPVHTAARQNLAILRGQEALAPERARQDIGCHSQQTSPPMDWALCLPSAWKRWLTFAFVVAVGALAGTSVRPASLLHLLWLATGLLAVQSGFSALWSP